MIETTTNMLFALRHRLHWAFNSDTAAPGTKWSRATPSHGHCAVVAMLVRRVFGGEYVSATVNGVSHWFNRIDISGAAFDIDLTGDQFGKPRVQVAPAGEIYEGTRVRLEAHINQNTTDRFQRLLARMP